MKQTTISYPTVKKNTNVLHNPPNSKGQPTKGSIWDDEPSDTTYYDPKSNISSMANENSGIDVMMKSISPTNSSTAETIFQKPASSTIATRSKSKLQGQRNKKQTGKQTTKISTTEIINQMAKQSLAQQETAACTDVLPTKKRSQSRSKTKPAGTTTPTRAQASKKRKFDEISSQQSSQFVQQEEVDIQMIQARNPSKKRKVNPPKSPKLPLKEEVKQDTKSPLQENESKLQKPTITKRQHNIANSLSSNTLKIIQKVLKENPPLEEQKALIPQEQPQNSGQITKNQQKQKSPSKSVTKGRLPKITGEQNISFQDIETFEQKTSPYKNLKFFKPEPQQPQLTQTQQALLDRSHSVYSSITQKVLQDLRSDPTLQTTIQPRPLASYSHHYPQPSPHQPTTNNLLLTQDLRLKHSDLLKVTRELILPMHYKSLLTLSSLLDNSLNFMKLARKSGMVQQQQSEGVERENNEGGGVSYLRVKESIEKTHGKKFDINDFRKLVYIVPEFYTHHWSHISKYATNKEPILFIDFVCETGKLTQRIMDDRQQLLKQRLLDLTKHYHDQHLHSFKHKLLLPQGTSLQDIQYLESFDPIKSQMWHSSFDPHLCPEVPLGELKPKPKQAQSESVREFLNKSQLNMTRGSIVQQALEKSAIIKQEEQSNSKTRGSAGGRSSAAKKVQQEAKLQEQSQKIGISVDTLKQILAKKDVIMKHRDMLSKSMILEDDQKRLQELQKLASMLKSTFDFKCKTTLSMNELAQSIMSDRQRGNFQSLNQIVTALEELAQNVPEWLTIKMLAQGRFLSINKALSINQVIDKLKSRIQSQSTVCPTQSQFSEHM